MVTRTTRKTRTVIKSTSSNRPRYYQQPQYAPSNGGGGGRSKGGSGKKVAAVALIVGGIAIGGIYYISTLPPAMGTPNLQSLQLAASGSTSIQPGGTVMFTVTAFDTLNQPLAGATPTLTVQGPNGTNSTAFAATNSNGQSSLTVTYPAAGSYSDIAQDGQINSNPVNVTVQPVQTQTWTLVVNSQGVSGATINGYDQSLFNDAMATQPPQGIPPSPNFTPNATWSGLVAGTTYYAVPQGTSTVTFAHWSDGSTANPRPVTGTAGATVNLVAVYNGA